MPGPVLKSSMDCLVRFSRYSYLQHPDTTPSLFYGKTATRRLKTLWRFPQSEVEAAPTAMSDVKFTFLVAGDSPLSPLPPLQPELYDFL